MSQRSGRIDNGIQKEFKAAPRLYPHNSCFDRGRRIQHDLLMITQPLSMKMLMGKGKVDNCYAEFKGRETLSKAATS
jgi:zona occludens toxin (predicted ATPase)